MSGDIPLILSISLATFMGALDGTIVNIALPTISTSFDLSTSTVSWVSTIYLLVMAGCVLIFGKVSDVIGFKRVFITGFIIFTTGSFTCAVLPDLTGSFLSLIGSRVFQGIGGAMITAIAPAMVNAYILRERKGQAMGIIMTVAALGTAIGPTIGGLLTEYLSWHWIFFINVPVGILAVVLGIRVIPSGEHISHPGSFDRTGAALIFSGLALLLFGVTEGDTLGWTSPVILTSLVLAILILALFIRQELTCKDPLLELRLFHNRNFLFSNCILVLVFFSFSGINYLLPFYLQYVGGYSTSTSGLILTALSVAMMISGILAGSLYNRIGGRIISIMAAITLAAGYFLIMHLRADTPVLFVIACLFVIGFGLGLIITPVSNLVMSSTARKYQGMVSSLTSLERFAPLTIGIAFFNLVFIQGMISIASHYNVTRSAPVTVQMEVLAAGFDLTFFVTFIFGLVIVLLSFLIREEVHPDYQDGGELPESAVV